MAGLASSKPSSFHEKIWENDEQTSALAWMALSKEKHVDAESSFFHSLNWSLKVVSPFMDTVIYVCWVVNICTL